MYLVPLCFLLPLGIYVGTVFHKDFDLATPLIFCCILILLNLVLYLFKKSSLSFASLYIVFFLLGIISIKTNTEDATNMPSIFTQEPAVIIFRVSSFPEFKRERTEFFAEIESVYTGENLIKLKIPVYVSIKNHQPLLGVGDLFLSSAKCREPVEYGVMGVPSFRERLSFQGVRFVCYISNPMTLQKIDRNNKNIFSGINALRAKMKSIILSRFPQPESGVILAMTLGIRSGLDEALIKSFRNSGTAHVLAISGLHVGIAGGFFYFLFRLLFRINHKSLILINARKISAFLSMPLLFIFCLLAGMSPSTQRALIMSCLFFISIALMRKPLSLYIVALSWSIMLLIEPAMLFDVSFQLSFAAVSAIILIVPGVINNLKTRFAQERKILSSIFLFLAALLLTSSAGFAGTAVLIAKYFKTLSLWFLPANLVAVPTVSGIVSLTLLYLPLSSLPDLLNPAGYIIRLLVFILLKTVRFFSDLPYSAIPVRMPALPEILFYYLLIVIIFLNFSWRRKFICVLILLVLLINYEIFSARRADGRLTVTFLDVGQGESTFINLPDGRTMLIDCGGKNKYHDAGERVIAPFLFTNRINRIDYLVLTHPESDHIGGMEYILGHFKTGEIWIPDTGMEFDPFKKSDIKILRLSAGEKINIGRVHFFFFNPEVKQKGTANNASLVFKLKFENISLLFTGDIEALAENSLLNNDLRSDLLKVPHHGSCTSSTERFLESVSPEIAVISAGRDNPFGHPCREVMERLKLHTRRIFSTSEKGSVTIESDGKRLCYRTYFAADNGCL